MDRTTPKPLSSWAWLRNEEGAIDLASVMVGVIVIGLIGGVIAAAIFAVIPWAQDAAAKHQLESIHQAENAYMGFSGANLSSLPANAQPNTYANSIDLANANLLINTPSSYCAAASSDGKSYTAYSLSATGKVWASDNNQTPPYVYSGTLSQACPAWVTGQAPPPYVDPTPTVTSFTYNCPTTTTGTSLPVTGGIKGTEVWSDGTPSITYNNVYQTNNKTLNAGQTYTVTFTGTYNNITDYPANNICLRSVDHWGSNSMNPGGSAAYGFAGAKNLVSVPAHLPTNLQFASYMFSGDPSFNDPNLSSWDTSHLTDMSHMFDGASSFNQPLNTWNVSNVTTMISMFQGDTAFNQPLDKWDVSKVTSMMNMFQNASSFNQPLNTWNTAQVKDMYAMFNNANAFNQPVNKWNVSSVTRMEFMFAGAAAFNQTLNGWDTSHVTDMASMFSGTTAFNSPLDQLNTSSLTDIHFIFQGAKAFNQPLNTWNVSKVTNMQYAFQAAKAFNQPLNNWNTGAVTNMNYMFDSNPVFNQDLSGWNVAALPTHAFFQGPALQAAYLPKFLN